MTEPGRPSRAAHLGRALTCALVSFGAASAAAPPPGPPSAAPTPAPKPPLQANALRPLLPDAAGPYDPARVRLVEPRELPPASVGDARDCGGCHADVAAQWRTSAHALASFTNPLYRVSIEGLQAARGTRPSRMCAGCHDLALLAAGLIDAAAVDPDDARAHAGVSCTTCHSVVHATREGNGGLALRGDVALPSDPERSTLEAHRRRVAADALRTAELCAGCHRAFLDASTGNGAALLGMDDYGAWLRSAWAGSGAERPDAVAVRDCRGCHMPREAAPLGDVAARDGGVPSHRFLGGHTALAAMRGDPEQLERQRAFLAGAVTVDVAAARVAGGPWVMPAEHAVPRAGALLELDVVIFNAGVGHRFPGGTLDNQGTRLEVVLRTARGRSIASSSEHVLRSEIVDAQGRPRERRETHEFLATVWNHTVPSRDARAARFRLRLPASLSSGDLPLVAEARVVHVSRSDALARLACDDARTQRGAAFRRGALAHTGSDVDGCAPQPRTLVATRLVSLDGRGNEDGWQRAYHRGLALSVGLQEYLDEAEAAFEHALARATGRDVAVVRVALGSLAGRRGQLARALRLLDEASRELGSHPAVERARGDAYAQVWRWGEAALAYRAALQRAPADVALWQALAMAEASVGDPAAALAAAQGGLRLQPRDGDCLRVQALALEKLGAPSDAALDVALEWRAPDDAPSAKARCSAQVPGCDARRNPVPVYELAAREP